MSLAANLPIGFIPTKDAKAARVFYEQTLGLGFESEDPFAIVFRIGPQRSMLRITPVPNFAPAPYTIFGWQVDDIDSTVAALTTKGVAFQRYNFLEHNKAGIWTAPGGTRIAWFHDPDGNTLSLSQHPE